MISTLSTLYVFTKYYLVFALVRIVILKSYDFDHICLTATHFFYLFKLYFVKVNMCPRLKVKDFSTCLKIKTSSLLPHSSLPLNPAPPGATTFNTSGCVFFYLEVFASVFL